MDDLKVSSKTLREHIEHVEILCQHAASKGLEFKMKKGQLNQHEIELWGCICDGEGRHAQPKKVKQLAEWPLPQGAEAVYSFLCFVSYLREYMAPECIEWEQVLRPFRKKGVEFAKLWGADKDTRIRS